MTSGRFDVITSALSMLGETGDIQLASLTREELRAVGDDPLLGNAADSLWWDGLSERERELVLETAQRGLVARNLLTSDGAEGLDAVDEVRLVLAARTAPDWIVVLGEPEAERDSDGAPVQLALLAVPTARGNSPAVLVTARLEGIYLHRLVTTDQAYAVAADWLLRPSDDAQVQIARTVEVLAPSDEVLVPTRGLVVGSNSGEESLRFLSEVVDGEPGEPIPVDVAALAGWLRERLATARSRDDQG